MTSEWIGSEINEILSDVSITLQDKIELSYKLLQSASSEYDKPTFGLWAKLLNKIAPKSIKDIEEEFSWLSISDQEFRVQNHVSMYLFFSQINPNKEDIKISEKHYSRIKSLFTKQLKRQLNMEDLKGIGSEIDCIFSEESLSNDDKIMLSYGLISSLSNTIKPSFSLWKTAFETSEVKNVEEMRKGIALLMEAIPEFKNEKFLEIHNLMRDLSSYDKTKGKKSFSIDDKNIIKAVLRLQLIKFS